MLKQYLIGIVITALSLICTVLVFNLVVDPYQLFDWVVIEGVNEKKTQSGERARITKPKQIIRQIPKTVIGGNSRVEIGIDPLSPCFPLDDRPVYNLGIPGASFYMQVRYLQHAIDTVNPKMIIMSLDYIDFLIDSEEEDRRLEFNENGSLHQDWENRLSVSSDGERNSLYGYTQVVDVLKSLFSFDTFLDSLRTYLLQNKQYASNRTMQGFNPASDYLEIISTEGQKFYSSKSCLK